jgi:hypothetical protein
MSLTKLSLGANLIIPAQGEFGKGYPGWRRENPLFFFTVYAQSLLETGFFLLGVLWSDNTRTLIRAPTRDIISKDCLSSLLDDGGQMK